MILVLPPLQLYQLQDASSLLTPALLIYPEIVDSNLSATLSMCGGEPNRWRPHVKTAKIPSVLKQILGRGIRNLKCSTTLELLICCQAAAPDVLLAFAVLGANARRVQQIAQQFPETRISVLVESAEQAEIWRGTTIGIFIDVNSGMNRTGLSDEGLSEIVQIAAAAADRFRGIHFYDGHMSSIVPSERERSAHAGYDRLLRLVDRLEQNYLRVDEVITSGTPAAPFAISYDRFLGGHFVHRISPGTVVYNDLASLGHLPGEGYRPAAIVLSTVVSHPTSDSFTCDAGHKSVSADAGVPTCAVLGAPDLEPMKPSEEHLPIRCPEGHRPALGSHVYLVPRHVCPTVNNFDQAILVVAGKIHASERVTARGHESPLAGAGVFGLAHDPPLATKPALAG